MHASCTCTSALFSFTCLQKCTHTHTHTCLNVTEHESSKVTPKKIKQQLSKTKCLLLTGKGITKGFLKKLPGLLPTALIVSARRSSLRWSWRWHWQAGRGPAQQRGGWRCLWCFPAYVPQTQRAWKDKSGDLHTAAATSRIHRSAQRQRRRTEACSWHLLGRASLRLAPSEERMKWELK